MNVSGGSSYTAKKENGFSATTRAVDPAPTAFVLNGTAPNPVRAQTTIRYGLPERADVRLIVYDTLGRKVARLADGSQQAGWHRARFEAGDLPAGVYLVRIQAGSFAATKRLVLAR